MGVITLTSDWGLKDYYLSSVKGMIYQHYPEARIVDISHEIQPFNINEAAYILKNAYKSFPDGTVHIIGLNSEESLKTPHVAVFHHNQYFIGTDNGIFSLIFGEQPEKAVVLDIIQESEKFTFSERDRFVKAAVHLAKGGKLEELGNEKEKLIEKLSFEPVVSENMIRGMVLHVDNYENLVTNISEALFKKVVNHKKFEISFRSYTVNSIQKAYSDSRPGEIAALFASNGLLEIAINKGNASSLLGIIANDPIIIEIKEEGA